MSTVAQLFNDGVVRKKIKSQLKLIKKNKIDTRFILTNLEIHFKDKIQVTREGPFELYLKADKKTGVEALGKEIHRFLSGVTGHGKIDPKFLFNIFISGNDVYVRAKR